MPAAIQVLGKDGHEVCITRPSTYNIMLLKKDTSSSEVHKPPIISPEHVKRHLVLLHAFHEQRRNVKDLDHSLLDPDIAALDHTRRWSLFVTRAVERYESSK
jgi:hypothetical protein